MTLSSRLRVEVTPRGRVRLLKWLLCLLALQTSIAVLVLVGGCAALVDMADVSSAFGGDAAAAVALVPPAAAGCLALLVVCFSLWGAVVFLQLRSAASFERSGHLFALTYALCALVCAVGCVLSAVFLVLLGLQLPALLTHNLPVLMRSYADDEPAAIVELNELQQTFQCCGVDGPASWSAVLNDTDLEAAPWSCCLHSPPEAVCPPPLAAPANSSSVGCPAAITASLGLHFFWPVALLLGAQAALLIATAVVGRLISTAAVGAFEQKGGPAVDAKSVAHLLR